MNDQDHAPAPERIHDLDVLTRTEPAKKILIVEDDLELTELVKAHLENCGYDVESATDGVQGVKRIMAGDYHVVLCDMVMPNLAGDMFYRAVERVKPHLCKRFVFITGYQKDKKIEGFIRSVRGLVVWKPFEMHVLLEAIHAAEELAARYK